MKLIIRKMTLEDVPSVIDLDQKSFSLPWPERSFRFELTANPASRCWVAELEGKVVGMIVVVGMDVIVVVRVIGIVHPAPVIDAHVSDDTAAAIFAHDQDTSTEARSSSRPWRTSVLGVWQRGHSQKTSPA